MLRCAPAMKRAAQAAGMGRLQAIRATAGFTHPALLHPIANLGPGRWHSTATQSRSPSHDATILNPPVANVKLNPERPPSHEFHRHSTRYSRSSREVLEALDKDWMDQPHYEPVTWQDRAALRMVKTLRKASDAYFKDRLLDRACMLETIAAVPGHSGWRSQLIHYMRSLRRLVHCNWIKPTMDEAENERMHLMTFMELAKQRWHQRVLVVCGQGVFFAAYTIFYVVTPRIAHRFVGYLEEEAVHTYTEMLKMVDEGKIENVPAPKVAIQYWNMPEDATLRDVILVVRADEADHRLVNHHMGDLIANAKGKGPVREGCSDYKPCDEFHVDLSIDLGPTIARRKPPAA
mmetsp:Transcript_44013/g.102729  ORF Transcript_44013/g.102729 Transcript_44013/m.102729 type:complete len:347 (+) Transcript_44013:61-1101(+)